MLVAILCSLGPRPAGAQELGASAFDEAREAFEAGRFAEAEEAFAALAARDPTDATALFWKGYAAWKAGDPIAAAAAAEAALRLEPAFVDAAYLAGLAAGALGDLERARARLEVVRALAPDGALGRSAAEHLDLLRWRGERDEAIRLLQAGRIADGLAILDRLEAERPGDRLVRYHRAWVAWRRGEHLPAVLAFEALLAEDPGDGWAAYMRAMALLGLGDRAAARQALEALTGDADATIAAEARVALDSLGQDAPVTGGAAFEAWDLRLGLAADVDTNPAWVAESQYVQQGDPALAASSFARAQGPLKRWERSTLWLAPSLLARTYVAGPHERDLVRAEVRLEADRGRRPLLGWVGLGGGGALLGWTPLLDAEEVYLGGEWWPASAMGSRIDATAYRRRSHLDGFENLSALGARLAARQRFDLPWGCEADAGWVLQGEAADPYRVAWEEQDSAGATWSALLVADASWAGHGPRATVAWKARAGRAEARIEGELQWRRFSTPERVTWTLDDEQVTWEGQRQDRRLALDATFGIRLHRALHLLAAASLIDNASSLDGDGIPVDRSFRRALLSLGVEVRP